MRDVVRRLSSFGALRVAELPQRGVRHFGNIGRTCLTGSLEGLDRAVAVALLLEHQAEVARPRGVAALLGALVGGLGAGTVTLVLQNGAEIPRADGMTAGVGSLVRRLGCSEIAALLEQ